MAKPNTIDPKVFPALFVSHGSPMVALQDEDAYTRALTAFAERLPGKPKAVVFVSAHGLSESKSIEVSVADKPHLVYDFRGFPGELYQIEYPCKGNPEVAMRIASLASAAGFETVLTKNAGIDHGVWIPMRILFPDADVPVVQVSMPYPSSPEEVMKLGRALAPLRAEGVLLVGSGGLVHNLRELVWHGKNGPAKAWAQDFDNWVFDTLARKDVLTLAGFEEEAPGAAEAHPSAEHFYPLFFTVGASRSGDRLESVYRGIEYGTLSMSCFALLPDPVSSPVNA